MSEHLSALVLDEVAAGLAPPAEAQTHLASCDDCRAKLETLKASREAVAASAKSKAVLQHLLTRTEAPAPKKGLRLVHVAAIALPLAAVLALLVFNPIRPAEDSRFKGAASVELLDAQGTPVTRAKVGDTLTLAVGGAGYRYAAVVAVDGQGLSTLWPKDGTTLAPLEPGARVRLSSFTVTPGNVRLVAYFSSKELPLGKVTLPLLNVVAKRAMAHQPPLDFELPPSPAEGVAQVRLEVIP